MEGKVITLSHYEKEKLRSQRSASIFDSIVEGSSKGSIGSGSLSSSSSVAGIGGDQGSVASGSQHSHATGATGRSKRSTKGGKTMTAAQIEESMTEMETLLQDMEGKDVRPGESWAR